MNRCTGCDTDCAGASGREPAATGASQCAFDGNHSRAETAVVSAQVVGRIQQVLVREETACGQADAGGTRRRGPARFGGAGPGRGKGCARRAGGAQTDAKLAQHAGPIRSCRPRRGQSTREDELHSGPRRRRQGLRQCEHRPMRRVPRRAAHTRCLAIRVCLRHFRRGDSTDGRSRTLASPGVPLLQVDKAGALQLEATVDESAIGAIHKG